MESSSDNPLIPDLPLFIDPLYMPSSPPMTSSVAIAAPRGALGWLAFCRISNGVSPAWNCLFGDTCGSVGTIFIVPGSPSSGSCLLRFQRNRRLLSGSPWLLLPRRQQQQMTITTATTTARKMNPITEAPAATIGLNEGG